MQWILQKDISNILAMTAGIGIYVNMIIYSLAHRGWLLATSLPGSSIRTARTNYCVLFSLWYNIVFVLYKYHFVSLLFER